MCGRKAFLSLGNPLRQANGARGTNQSAEVATHAFRPIDLWHAVVAKSDGLMASVLARHIATATSDAHITVDLGIDHRLTVEL